MTPLPDDPYSAEIDEIMLSLRLSATVTNNQEFLIKEFTEAKAKLSQIVRKARLEGRKTAKQENANDFTAIVESFNRAVKASYDHYSMQNLGFLINNADARAKYEDLPEQLQQPDDTTKEVK